MKRLALYGPDAHPALIAVALVAAAVGVRSVERTDRYFTHAGEAEAFDAVVVAPDSINIGTIAGVYAEKGIPVHTAASNAEGAGEAFAAFLAEHGLTETAAQSVASGSSSADPTATNGEGAAKAKGRRKGKGADVVVTPSGADDTAQLQGALDEAAATDAVVTVDSTLTVTGDVVAPAAEPGSGTDTPTEPVSGAEG